jgi:hypothetical protein
MADSTRVNNVDLDIKNFCEQKTKELGGDIDFQKDLESKIRKVIIDDEIGTDQINQIGQIIVNKIGKIEPIQSEIEAKKIVLETENWEKKHIDEVREARAEDFSKRLEEEYKKINPEITDDQLGLVKEEAVLIKEVYFSDGGIEDQKTSVIEANQDLSVGKITNAWNDTQGIVGLLKKTPKRFEEIKETYSRITNGLEGLNSPFERLPKLASFERVMNSIQGGDLGKAFSLVQGGGWWQKVDGLTGGWLNKTVVEAAGKFASKIGGQAVGSFVQNSVGILAKEGLSSGLKTILSGALSGGVQAATGAAATGAAAGVAGAASGPIGWAVLAAKALGVGIKKGLEKLGIDLNKIKDNLSITGNKVADYLIGVIGSIVAIPAIIGALSLTLITPVIIIVFVGLFGLQISQSSLISSIVQPVDQPLISEDETATGSGSVSGASCAGGVLNVTNIYEPINISQIKTRLSKSEYSYKSNGDIDFSCINALLPEKLTHKRSDILKAAYALLGVPYWMGGGHGTIASGVSSDWGKRVSAPSSGWNEGRRYHGLDCSGFVRWVYKYVTGETVGNLAADIYSKSEKISKSELKPGDIGFLKGSASNHIGLFLGKGTNGKYYFIHDAGRSSGAGPQGLGGVYISAANFNYFGRIKVTLAD